jgi:hypothetical protein
LNFAVIIQISQEEVESFLKGFIFELKASQNAISFPIIKRIHKRVQQGHIFSPVKVLNGIIIDGHHRYICLTLLGLKTVHIKAGRNDANPEIKAWDEVFLDPIDYDTLLEISEYETKYD